MTPVRRFSISYAHFPGGAVRRVGATIGLDYALSELCLHRINGGTKTGIELARIVSCPLRKVRSAAAFGTHDGPHFTKQGTHVQRPPSVDPASSEALAPLDLTDQLVHASAPGAGRICYASFALTAASAASKQAPSLSESEPAP